MENFISNKKENSNHFRLVEHELTKWFEQSLLNIALTWELLARIMGQRWQRSRDMWCADTGLPGAFFNRATIINPSPTRYVGTRIMEFYADSPICSYAILDPSQNLDLSELGMHLFEPYSELACMARPPGGVRPPLPEELEIFRVEDKRTLRWFESIIVESFSISDLQPMVSRGIFNVAILQELGFRLWVGMVSGQPVATAAAHIAYGVTGVYLVSTIPDMRGRGIGTALSWEATMTEPDMPATLQASSMGQPVYKKIGYRVMSKANMWLGNTKI